MTFFWNVLNVHIASQLQLCVDGVLILFVQEEKVYVQHRVRDNARLLWDLIASKGACFYIAGWVQRGTTSPQYNLNIYIQPFIQFKYSWTN